jgi:hypothetical protein
LKPQDISGQFKNFTRMSPTDFEYLLNLVGPKIKTKDTKFRKAVSVQDKLALTLRFLATGDSSTSMQYLFRISKQVISMFVPQVCQAIISELRDHIKVCFNSVYFIYHCITLSKKCIPITQDFCSVMGTVFTSS